MKCSDCLDLLSRYIDGDLDEAGSSSVAGHLAVCAECTLLRDDLAEILIQCREGEDLEAVPPNPAALWRRINNLIESELPAEIPVQQTRRGWLGSSYLSVSQAAVGVVVVAVISSLLTIVGIRNYFAPPGDDLPTSATQAPSLLTRGLRKIGLAETPQQARERRFKEQESAIEYWNKRAQARRAAWDARMTAAFDRNLNEIDQAVNEYTSILQNDPDDKLSEEMLDSALTEKMNLLRQFSEL
jgi:hypothetical protein